MLAARDGPLDGRCPPVFGQQRGVQVQVAQRRQIEHPLGDDPPISDNDNHLWLERLKLRLELGIDFDFFRLRNLQS